METVYGPKRRVAIQQVLTSHFSGIGSPHSLPCPVDAEAIIHSTITLFIRISCTVAATSESPNTLSTQLERDFELRIIHISPTSIS